MAADHPLPGDLIVREYQTPKSRATDGWITFIVAVHPALIGGTAHRTLQSAVLLARALATKRGGGLQVWHELRGHDGAYENLTK